MPQDTAKATNDIQFENTDTISRFEYVNTGKINTPNNSGVVLNNTAIAAIPYDLTKPREGANKAQNFPTDAIGVYSAFPSMSPKYVRHSGARTAGHLGGLARIYVPVSSPVKLANIKKQFANRYKENSQMYAVAEQVFGTTAGKESGAGYLDFVLMSVSQVLDEKYQISEVLEDNYVAFFFGQRAPMWTFSGALMNTYQDDWTMNMWRLYSEIGRGTRLAQRGLLMSIRYDSMIVTGGMTRFQWDLSSSNELFTSFSFQFLMKSITPIRGSKAKPTKLPEAYGSFNDTGLNLSQVPDDSVMPVVSESGADAKVNDQAAAKSTSVVPASLYDRSDSLASGDNADAYVDDLYRAGARAGTSENMSDNDRTLIALFGTTAGPTVNSNPPRGVSIAP